MTMPLDKALEELEDEIFRQEASLEACRLANLAYTEHDDDALKLIMAPRYARLEALEQVQRVCLMVWNNRDKIRALLKKNGNGDGAGTDD
jgi:hypothetical protein